MRFLLGDRDIFDRTVKNAFPKRRDAISAATRENFTVLTESCAVYATFVRFERPRASFVAKIPDLCRSIG